MHMWRNEVISQQHQTTTGNQQPTSSLQHLLISWHHSAAIFPQPHPTSSYRNETSSARLQSITGSRSPIYSQRPRRTTLRLSEIISLQHLLIT